ncbi:DUF6644 family protein [Hydrocarboniphaga sp.]|uniref:DUF6644 family protein n=1 Tax=Hydrocarboniphaga sp. TaxID=2033016 RepID=UPI003D129E10
MSLQTLFTALENSGLGTAVRESTILFPAIECLHVLMIAVMVGTIAIVDLRLLGIASRTRSVSELLDEVLPFTRGAFVGALITGGLLFASHASDYVGKWPFQAKMALLLLAMINIVVFHRIFGRDVASLDQGQRPPLSVRLSGGLSLALWIGVVATGRWIGFV